MVSNNDLDSSATLCYLCSPGYFASADLKSCQMSIPFCASVSNTSTCFPYCNCNACETGYVLQNRDSSDAAKGKVPNQHTKPFNKKAI